MDQYKNILKYYRTVAVKPLSLYEILKEANSLNIFKKMSNEELDELEQKSFGLTKILYKKIKEKRERD